MNTLAADHEAAQTQTQGLRVSAPGKVLWSGEYAVLLGAPAIVMAVNRRVQVTCSGPDPAAAQHIDDARWQIRSDLEAQSDAPPCFISPNAVTPASDPRGRVVAAACAALRQRIDEVPTASATIDIRSGNMAVNAMKLGIGSSAATAVATLVAVAAHLRLATDNLDWKDFLYAHEHLQGPGGSGADLAASRFGGLQIYTRTGPETATCAAVTLPPDLNFRLFWTGQSASTPAFLRDFARWREQSSSSGLVGEMSTAAAAVAATFSEARSADSVISSIGDFASLLPALGSAIGAPIISAPHEQLGALAVSHGVTYKPSGAGGGDLGLALSTNPEQLDQFEQAALTLGFPSVPLECDPNGVTIEQF